MGTNFSKATLLFLPVEEKQQKHFSAPLANAKEHEIAIWMVVPATNYTTWTATNVEIQLTFCVHCGPWRLLYRKGEVPDLDNYDSKVGGDNTGTEVNPAGGLFFSFELSPNDTTPNYVGLYWEYIECTIEILAVNMTKRAIGPYPPVPGNGGLLTVSRDTGVIHVTFAAAKDNQTSSDKLFYKPLIQRSFLGVTEDLVWCVWSEVPDIGWQAQVFDFDISVSDYDDLIIIVEVYSQVTNMTSFYNRIHVPYSTKENVVRTMGEIAISFMIVIPLLILYSGYARTFGISFLGFQFISLQYSINDVNTTKDGKVDPRQLTEDELDKVKLEQDSDTESSMQTQPPVEQDPAVVENEAISNKVYDPSKDLVMKKAARHITVLICIQGALDVIAVIISLATRSKIDLDMVFVTLISPVFIVTIVGTLQYDRNRILCYMVTMLWLSGLQITRMLFEMNFGDRTGSRIFFNPEALSENNYDESMAYASIIIQIIICISVSCMISSLAPASFMVIKTKEGLDQDIRAISPLQRTMMLVSIMNIVFALSWVTTLLHYAPYSGYTINWQDFFRLFVETQVTVSLSLLSLFCALAALYHNTTFCVISFTVQVFEIVFSIFMLVVDKNYVLPIYKSKQDVWIATTVLRGFSIACQFLMLVMNFIYFRRLRSAPVLFELKHALRNYGRGYNLAYFSRLSTLILAPIVAVIGVVLVALKVTSNEEVFPPIYMAYFWFVLSSPVVIISETHRSIGFLIYSIVVDVVGLFLLFYVIAPGPWFLLFFFPILKILSSIVSSAARCCCLPKIGPGDLIEQEEEKEEEEELETLDLGEEAKIKKPEHDHQFSADQELEEEQDSSNTSSSE